MKKFIFIGLYFLTFSLSFAANCGVNNQGNKYCSYNNGCYEYWNRDGSHFSSCSTVQNLPATNEINSQFETLLQKYREDENLSGSNEVVTVAGQVVDGSGVEQYRRDGDNKSNNAGYGKEELTIIFFIVLGILIWYAYVSYKEHIINRIHDPKETYGSDEDEEN